MDLQNESQQSNHHYYWEDITCNKLELFHLFYGMYAKGEIQKDTKVTDEAQQSQIEWNSANEAKKTSNV